MEVYAPGQTVTIADSTITATIACTAIYAHGGTLYEVVWWADGDRHSAWLSESEMVCAQPKSRVGFKPMGDSPSQAILHGKA